MTTKDTKDAAQQNPEVAGLKGKRPPRAGAQPGGTPLSAAMVHPPTGDPVPDGTVYQTLAAVHPRVLFDPAGMPLVVEEGGHVSEAILSDHYVISEFDAGETMIPPGCRTGITRTLWHKGNRVRKDAYAAYLSKYGNPNDAAQEPATA